MRKASSRPGNDWLHRFGHLRVDQDREKGPAPHKPLLLLAVLDLLESGLVTGDAVHLSPELVMRFQNFWPIVAARRQNQGDVRMPFHALATDGVWAVCDEEGRPSRARNTSIVARLPAELQVLLGQPLFRDQLRCVLLTYFPADEQIALAAALGLEAAPPGVLAEETVTPAAARARDVGRSARFKTEVVGGYNFTCALTGYRLTAASQLGIVEAAHIHALNDSLDNGPDNGLALTPTAHTLFDRGFWSVSDDLRILVKPAAVFLETAPPGGFLLRALHGAPLHLVPGSRLRPAPKHLLWHRRHHGF